MSILRPRFEGEPWRWDCEDEILPITSVGVLLSDSNSQFGMRILLVEQLDQQLEDGRYPWNIPAGKVQATDENIYAAMRRELWEESRLELPHDVSYFLHLERGTNEARRTGKKPSAKLVYFAVLPYADILNSLGDYNTVNRVHISNGNLNKEIARRAFGPADVVLGTGSPLGPSYRQDILFHIKAKLEGLRVI